MSNVTPATPVNSVPPGTHWVPRQGKSWFGWVGFWSAIAAIATGVNSTLGTGARYTNGWAAETYMEQSVDDYMTNPQLTDAYLARASRNADELFEGRALPTQAREDSKSPTVSAATPATSTTERQPPVRYTEKVKRLAMYGTVWGVVHFALAILGIVAPVIAWVVSGGGPVIVPPGPGQSPGPAEHG
jgi:hypothetical protein